MSETPGSRPETSRHTAPRHIGIVGCSAEGAALCYRTICTEGAALLGPHAHPEVSMHTPSLADYAARLEAWCRRAPEQWFNFYDFWSA